MLIEGNEIPPEATQTRKRAWFELFAVLALLALIIVIIAPFVFWLGAGGFDNFDRATCLTLRWIGLNRGATCLGME